MQRFAPYAHVAFVLIGVWSGYASLDLEALRSTNPDQLFALISFVTGIGFALAVIPFFTEGDEEVRAPSWRRLSFSWSHDPLQALFATTYYVGAMALGAACHLRGTTATGFWTFMFFVALFAGLGLGMIITYALFRARITKA